MRDRRAVSDLVGFVLAFSLVVTSVAVVSVVGLDGLRDARAAEQVSNSERAFDVLAHNVGDVYRRGAPSRATEIGLAGGQIGAGDPVDVTVEVASGGSTNTYDVTLDPLVYRSDDEQLVYSQTTVIRSGSGGAAVVREGELALPGDGATPNRTVLPLVRTIGPEATTGSDSTVLVRTTATDRSVLETARGGATVTLSIDTVDDRAAAWARYLEDEIAGTACTYPGAAPDTVTCTFDTTRVTVVRTDVRVVIGGT